jgi:hypothetical protein
VRSTEGISISDWHFSMCGRINQQVQGVYNETPSFYHILRKE